MDNLKTYTLDILSVLLPGGLLLAVLAQFPALECIFHRVFNSDVDWIKGVVYGGLAYTLGHFLFFIGSFLDNWIFENVKRVFWNDQRLVAYIISFKEEKTGIGDRKILNAFKWSCAWLLANKKEMYLGVERHIAESKFFRSLIVTLFIISIVYAAVGDWLLSGILALLIIPSLVRYLTQREKSIETAYQFVITASKKTFTPQPNSDIVSELNSRNIDPCKREGRPKPARFCTLRKILVVVGLCLKALFPGQGN